MIRTLVSVATIALFASAAKADEVCGHGTPESFELRDASADPHAAIFVGRVTAQHVSGSTFERRTGTIDVDVQTVIAGTVKAARVAVPASAAGCLPKAACPRTVFELATPKAIVLVACVLPAHGAPRVAIEPGDPPVPDDMRRCLAIADAVPHGKVGVLEHRIDAIATAYTTGAELAKSCAARIVCDDSQRTLAVRALARTVLAPTLDVEQRLELALGLTDPVTSAASLLGCPTTPKFFQAGLGGGDPTNALVAHTMLDGMLAATDADHRKRWANLLWGMLVEWYEKPAESAAALHVDKPVAARAIKMLRSLGGADAKTYEAIAKFVENANP